MANYVPIQICQSDGYSGNTITRSHADRVRTFLLMDENFGMTFGTNTFPPNYHSVVFCESKLCSNQSCK